MNSERLSRSLRFTVQSVTEGKPDQLKEYALALSVFDKRESFDPRFDPIVRVEAGRLRNRLKQYYESDGPGDPLIIDLPKGTYVPKSERYRPKGKPTILIGSRCCHLRTTVRAAIRSTFATA